MLKNLKYRLFIFKNRWRDNIRHWRYFKTTRSPLNNILIVKNDAIGDYIITRNLYYELKKDPKFRNCKFYLACSPKMPDIIRQTDPDLFSGFFPFDANIRDDETKGFDYFRELSGYRFKYLLHPTYSPNALAYGFAKFSNAANRIGFSADTTNFSEEEKHHYEKFYSELVSPPDCYMHEFERQKYFFSQVLRRTIDLKKPVLNVDAGDDYNSDLVLCPGAQHSIRIWDVENYAGLLTKIQAVFPDMNIKVVTGPGEDELNAAICSLLPFEVGSFKNPSIGAFIRHLAAARLIVSNDSAAAHIAVALSKKSVCLSNGNHYKRFVPYPEECDSQMIVVLPEQVRKDVAGGNYDPYYFVSNINMNTLNFDEVLEACLKQLNNA